jgi:hypothetical protein
VARRFMSAFERKDFQALRTVFAPNATVASALISTSGPHQLAYQSLDDWIKEAEEQLAAVEDFKVEPKEESVLQFESGATVSVRFHITGRVGKSAFVNDGVDTYAMVRVDGAWRILRYSYIEHPRAATS